jgi:thiol-disulfide isomerase/thioredoxin
MRIRAELNFSPARIRPIKRELKEGNYRLKIRLPILFLLAAFTVASTVAAPNSEKPASLTLHDMAGKKVRLSDLRGKVVVLNFWATWCVPCNAEMPMLVKTASAYAGKNVAFVGVSVDEEKNQPKVASFTKRLEIPYPIWIGATDDDMKHLDLGNAVPGTAFLDADGVIRARILGQMQPGEMEKRIDWLLAGHPAPDAPEAIVRHLEEK